MSFPVNHIRELQHHVAIVSVGPTDLRRMSGTKGKRPEMQDILSQVLLSEWTANNFSDQRNKLTKQISKTFGGNFGAARKAINLFLRECVNHYALRSYYNLVHLEQLLEVPLDSISMKAISDRCPTAPKPCAVSALTFEVSSTYQECAKELARTEGFDPVHLDVLWWGSGRKK